MRRTISRVSQLLLIVWGASCSGDSGPVTRPDGSTGGTAPAVTSVVLTATATTLIAGDSSVISAELHTVGSAPAAGWVTSWQTSDASIATVSSSGMVHGVAEGIATISATAGGKSASVTITVQAPPLIVSSIAVSPQINSYVAVGLTKKYSAVVTSPSSAPATGWKLAWKTSDPAVATVDSSGLVTAVAKGVATISASVGAMSGTGSVEVLPQPGVVSVQTSATQDFDLQQTTKTILSPQLTMVGTTPTGGLVYAWTSSDPAIASVAPSGTKGDVEITGVGTGTAKITVTAYGKTSSVNVRVVPKPVVTPTPPPPPSSTVSAITLDASSLVIPQGVDAFIDATITATTPQPSGGWPVVWSTADPSVAPLSTTAALTSARVHGQAPGKTTLTASLGGVSTTIDVYVAKPISWALPSSTLSMAVGTQTTITPVSTTVGPLPPTGWPVQWTSSSPLVATVSSTGVVRALAVGKTRLTAVSAFDTQSEVLTVTGPLPTVTLTVPDTVRGTVGLGSQGFSLICFVTTKATMTGSDLLEWTVAWVSQDGSPYQWSGGPGFQYPTLTGGQTAPAIASFSSSTPVPTKADLKPFDVGIQYHYTLNEDFFDILTNFAPDYMVGMTSVCAP